LDRKNKAKQSQFAGEAEPAQAIDKSFGFEAATQCKFEKTKPISKLTKLHKVLFKRNL
jgi:hypothetical protein